ncbi:MAG TPA: NmrA family NAD(P)-binding protein [Candidatus Kryptonia bacterium]
MKKIILVAGATGNLGKRVINALLDRGAEVRVVVRSSSDIEKLNELERLGVKIFKINMSNVEEMSDACSGVSCVVSALQGLHEVIVDTQRVLLDAAIAAGIPRFIPSDYSIDFTKLPPGENRNLDLRRDFHKRLDETSISATTIFNGAFTDLLTDQMPLILFKLKRVLYWGMQTNAWTSRRLTTRPHSRRARLFIRPPLAFYESLAIKSALGSSQRLWVR